jgi:hypothetical protein
MFDKIILILLLSLILMGVATIAVPFPVLWAMGCLTFLALSVILRSQKQA